MSGGKYVKGLLDAAERVVAATYEL